MTRGPIPSPRAVWVLAAVVVIFALGTAGWIVVRLFDLNDSVQTLQVSNTAQDDVLAAQESALREANRRLKQTGGTPVTVPETPPPPRNGEDGARGSTGATGGAGLTGATGATGARGPRGIDGAPGPVGETGATGAPGPATRGPQGEVGAAGPAGPRGETGAQGDRGPQGPAGADGTNGATGATGPAGTAQAGTYTCPDGQALHGFTVGDGGGVTLDCQPAPGLLGR